MVDSIFDRPMFGTPGTSEDIDKQIDRAGRAPEKNEITNKFPQYSYDQIYDDSFMPFDKEGIATSQTPVSYTHLTLPTNREV